MQNRGLAIIGIVIGALLMLSPVFGIVWSGFSVNHTLHTVGISHPQFLAENIGMTLFATGAGFILFPLGILILALSFVFYFRLRTPDSSSPITTAED